MFCIGCWVLSHRMAWSLANIFLISSVASFGVFSFIFPPAEASSSCLVCGLSPSMNVFNWIGLENPWVGFLLNKPLNLSNASLRDSLGNWWNEEIAAFPFAVLDSGKYFFRNLSTTSSQVLKLLPFEILIPMPDVVQDVTTSRFRTCRLSLSVWTD